MTRTWTAADFKGSLLPTALDGTGVVFGTKPAFVFFVSPQQVNFIVPNLDQGLVPSIRVQVAGQLLAPFADGVVEYCPAAFMFADQRFAIAVHADGTLAQTPSVPGRPTRPGDLVSLYVTGLGPTSPPYREGELLAGPLATRDAVRVALANTRAEVIYAGLVSPGLYQVNIRIPALAPGPAPLKIEVATNTSPDEVFLEIAP